MVHTPARGGFEDLTQGTWAPNGQLAAYSLEQDPGDAPSSIFSTAIAVVRLCNPIICLLLADLDAERQLVAHTAPQQSGHVMWLPHRTGLLGIVVV